MWENPTRSVPNSPLTPVDPEVPPSRTRDGVWTKKIPSSCTTSGPCPLGRPTYVPRRWVWTWRHGSGVGIHTWIRSKEWGVGDGWKSSYSGTQRHESDKGRAPTRPRREPGFQRGPVVGSVVVSEIPRLLLVVVVLPLHHLTPSVPCPSTSPRSGTQRPRVARLVVTHWPLFVPSDPFPRPE